MQIMKRSQKEGVSGNFSDHFARLALDSVPVKDVGGQQETTSSPHVARHMPQIHPPCLPLLSAAGRGRRSTVLLRGNISDRCFRRSKRMDSVFVF